ncbi:MAG: FG-GAP-like repeat-containing protein [bacterium]
MTKQSLIVLLSLFLLPGLTLAQNTGFALPLHGQDDSMRLPDSPEFSCSASKNGRVETRAKVWDSTKTTTPRRDSMNQAPTSAEAGLPANWNSEQSPPAGAADSSAKDHLTSAPHNELSFTDITESAGTGGPEGRGTTGGHAAIFADINRDGLPDLYHTMLFKRAMPDLFFLNLGNNVFAEEGEARGIDDFDGGSHGAVFADLDNDGDFDLFNGTTGRLGDKPRPEHNNIYRNDGNGFFTDMTDGTDIEERKEPTRGVVAFDMDGDGNLDLLAITNFQGSDDPRGERNELYRNRGNFNFREITSGDLYTAPAGQGATDTDFDNDGDIDIIAANRTGPLNILKNDGAGNFTRISPGSIGITHRGREGATLGDINNDGHLDMLLSDFDETKDFAIEHLYINDGDGTFTFQQTFKRTHGFMGAFGDLDNDGDLDIVFAGDDKCYLNDGDGNYTPGPDVPTDGINDPRAIAFADIDNDGDLDFAIGAKRSRNWLVRNNFDGGNWLKVSLISPHGQAGAFGAKVKVTPSGTLSLASRPTTAISGKTGRKGEYHRAAVRSDETADGTLVGYREARATNGYLGQNDPVLHFGLGEHTTVDVEVQFLSGKTFVYMEISSNQLLQVDATQRPHILAFHPIAGQAGTEVSILGSHFTAVNRVVFNDSEAASFTIRSDTLISAVVGAGATTGPIIVSGEVGADTSEVDFTVLHGTQFVFAPIADTFVRSSGTNRGNGRAPELQVSRDSSLERVTYLKFEVDGVTGEIRQARLRLHVLDGGDDGGAISLAENTYLHSEKPWREHGLTWENAPAARSLPLAVSGPVSSNEWIEFDLTDVMPGDGIYSLLLKNTSPDKVVFGAREHEFGPELIVVTHSEESSEEAQVPSADPDDSAKPRLSHPTQFQLHANYPNPFNAETVISYALPEPTEVKLTIHNLRGRVVRKLVDEVQLSGEKRVLWDGRDGSGRVVASGLYFVRLAAGGYRFVRRITLQK